MCLAIPGRIIEIVDAAIMTMATVDYPTTTGTTTGTMTKQCCLAYLPDARVGDYVIVQNGFAIVELSEQEALASLALFAEVGLA
jgi:hydrogenase expression/formation protein HypC